MLEVLALDRADGWAFVREGRHILLLRPPYHLHDARYVTERTVELAIAHHDYAACNKVLDTLDEVRAFVRGEVAAQRRAEGRALPPPGVGRALLKNASITVIERFLERIEIELIPQGQTSMAEEILLAMVTESSCLREAPELFKKASALLVDVRRRHEERLNQLERAPGGVKKAAYPSRERAHKLFFPNQKSAA